MKKKITITESELRSLIEGAINELSWVTYASAMQKNDANKQNALETGDKEALAKAYRRSGAFRDKANDEFRKAHNLDPNSSVNINGSSASYRPSDAPVDYRFTDYTQGKQGPWERMVNKGNQLLGKDAFTRYWNRQYERPPYHANWSDVKNQTPEVQDLARFYNGRSKYVPGKGWNESLIRKITENVIRRLKR